MEGLATRGPRAPGAPSPVDHLRAAIARLDPDKPEQSDLRDILVRVTDELDRVWAAFEALALAGAELERIRRECDARWERTTDRLAQHGDRMDGAGLARLRP